MSDSSLYVRNWRDFQPDIAHLNAVHWGGLRDVDRDDSDDERHRLQRLDGFARHALQGRKTSDHHKHDDQEQVYYVLSGTGEVLFDETRHPVEAGDAVYLPSGIHHQMFNEESDEWLEYHVISQAVDGNGGTFRVQHWRDASPAGDGAGGVRWRQLRRTDESGGDGAVLRGLHHLDRFAVQPLSASAEHVEADLEQVWYVLDGQGHLEAGGEEHSITEGDMIHLPPGTEHRLRNDTENWVRVLVIAA